MQKGREEFLIHLTQHPLCLHFTELYNVLGGWLGARATVFNKTDIVPERWNYILERKIDIKQMVTV